MKDKIEYIYSVAVYQKYLTRLGEMIISSPRFCGKAASCLCRLLVKRTPLKHGYLHWPNKVEMALNTIQSIIQPKHEMHFAVGCYLCKLTAVKGNI